MERYRVVDTPLGPITYLLVKKRVKNLNLHIRRDGTVVLSIPTHCPLEQADHLIAQKGGWIMDVRARMADRTVPLLPGHDREECLRLLEDAVGRVYPLVEGLGVARPLLKLRKMRSQWGNCHWSQGYITLNVALARCPEGLRDYVALHELVHFLHHDHGPGFYARMDTLMPDWRRRRQELKKYSGALETAG